jgi:hypothetical protein
VQSVICTLFEGHYHYGLAALANSLYVNGFRGSIYAGYRGALRGWSSEGEINPTLMWHGASTLRVTEGLKIHFLPLDTNYHLTNYKPDFMLRLLAGPAKEAKAIFYFDPDIVIKCKWEFFEKWMKYGVAVIHEIMANPMPSSHPIRLGWEEVMEKINKKTTRALNYYFNAGFCGISVQHIEFLNTWSRLVTAASEEYGLEPCKFVSSPDRTQHFNIIDQDAFNITAMCSESPISEMGPDGMDFYPGGWVMSHSTGSPKPWKKRFLLSALSGLKPSRADREYLKYANGTIKTFKHNIIRLKKIDIAIAGLIGRFYSR